MKDYQKEINKKVDIFINKKEIAWLIKGLINIFIFFSFTFILIVVFENYLWLKPKQKQVYLDIFYIFFTSIFLGIIVFQGYKIARKKKDFHRKIASKEIWKLSQNVSDKLLNFFQLKENKTFNFELLDLSVNKKAQELINIPFENLINLKKSLKNLRYLIIPSFTIFIVILFLGMNNFFGALSRIVNKDTEFIKPAPFDFNVEFQNKIIQNEDCLIKLNISGKEIPENVKIVFESVNIYIQKNDINNYSYVIKNIEKDVSFYFEASGFKSKSYLIQKIDIPQINDIELKIIYPKYMGKLSQIVENKGIIYVNENSTLRWDIKTKNTNSILVLKDKKEIKNILFENGNEEVFYSKITENTQYDFFSSNSNFENFEKINYTFLIIKDKYPEIVVIKDETALTQNVFLGKIQDDILLKSLKVYIYDKYYPENKQNIEIDTNIGSQSMEFKYIVEKQMLDFFKIENLCIYFEVEDNDQINGFKKTVTEVFEYKNSSKEELEEQFSERQNELIQNTERMIDSKERLNSIEKIEKKLAEGDNLDWIEKQEINKQAQNIKDNFDNFKELSESFNKSIEQQIDKDDLKGNQEYENLKENINKTQERIREELLKNIEDLKKDISKDENSLNKLNDLKQQNQRTQADLKRMLNLLKKFKFENDIKRAEKMAEDLSKDLDNLSKDEELDLQKQNAINQKAEILKKIIEKQDEISKKENYKYSFSENKEILNEAIKEIEKAKDDLKNKNKKQAQEKDKNASEKVKKIKKKIKDSQTESKQKQLKTDTKTIRIVLNNLMVFSFKQEENIIKGEVNFSNIHSSGIEKNIIEENKLRSIFSPIKDSIYNVGNKNMFLKDDVFKNITLIEKEFVEFTNNVSNDNYQRLPKNQIKIMGGTNDLAVLLSDVLQNLEEDMKDGEGKDGEGDEQKEKMDKMQQKIHEEIEKLMKEGQEKKEANETQKDAENQKMSATQLKIYQEHEILREQIMKMTQDKNLDLMMENLSNDILNNKLSNASKKNIQNINQRFLQIKNSIYQKEEDRKRKAESSKKQYQGVNNDNSNLEFKNIKKENIEILKYKMIEYNPFFQQKIDKYFE